MGYSTRYWLIGLTIVATAGGLFAQSNERDEGAYDPLAIAEGFEPRTLDLVVTDSQRSREIPVLVYVPSGTEPAAVVLFSHGLGGSRQGNAYLGRHWAARGYVVVFVQHPGSDDSVWRDVPRRERMSAMMRAASPGNFMLRVRDVPAVLDQLELWNVEAGHALFDRLDLDRVGMSGHSFGAMTTQAVSGQTTARARLSFRDPRIKAAVAMSPSAPRWGDAKRAFGAVDIPWLLMTGTHDEAVIGQADATSRLKVFPALPDGGKYELVLDGAEHSAFSDRTLPGDTQPRNANHHRVILALSTAFWDAYLGENSRAKAWLDGDGPWGVLEVADGWRRK